MHQYLPLLTLFLSLPGILRAEPWLEALSRMPLGSETRLLNRTNCATVLLSALRPDPGVKALIFMPGATDELYFFRRVQAVLTNANPTLLDAVVALTNQSPLRVTFRPPFLMLHSGEDVLDLRITVRHPPTEERLKTIETASHWILNDRDWDGVLAQAGRKLKVGLRPWPGSRHSWHFYRHSLAAWNLTAWEALQAFALGGKTSFTVNRNRVDFVPDERIGELPRLDHFPR